MKKILLSFTLLIAISTTGLSSFAESKTVIASGTFDVPNIWSLEFYTEPGKVLYSTEVPFTNVAPITTYALADGRADYDGKSDVGLIARTNLGTTWYLKIHASPSDSPLITLANIKYYLGQPWNRTLNKPSDGDVTGGAAWHEIPPAASIIYTAGQTDLINTPYGTLCTFSFSINPSRLSPTEIYNCMVYYTLTTTP